MPENTIGQALDSVLDSVSSAMDSLVNTINDLSQRVAILENARNTQPAPTPVVTQPVVNLQPVITATPQTTSASEEPTRLASGAHIHVREGTRAGSMPVIHMNDVVIEIDGFVDSIWIADARRVIIRGKGTVGRITVSEWASGRSGFRNSDIDISEVTFTTDRTAMEIQHAENVRVVGTRAVNVRNYALWLSSTVNAAVFNNDFSTAGDESCVRLVDVQRVNVLRNNIRSLAKHCFRIHGQSSNVSFVGNTVSGPRFSMVGTMPGDVVRDVEMLSNNISGASVQLLGVPVSSPTALQNFTYRDNTATNSVDTELDSYQGVATWTIVR